jgi:hypothetical protein
MIAQPIRLRVVSGPRAVAAGIDFTVAAAIYNGGDVPLDSTGPTPLRLAYRWQGTDLGEPLRTLLLHPIAPDAIGLCDVRVLAPPSAGRYPLDLTMVRESVRWYDRGPDAIVARVEIEVVSDAASIAFDAARCERRLRSQNGEDGILAELALRVGAAERYVVEFGASDGFESNVTTLIEDYRWGGALIESDPARFAGLRERYRHRPDVRPVHAAIDRDNAVAIFAQAQVPAAFDILSIDIDGNDYWVWQALAADYRPRIVVIEYNGSHPPPERWVMAYAAGHRWAGDTYYGASLASLTDLATRLGYVLVATDSHGINAFFVRADLARAAGLATRSAQEAFTPPAVDHPHANGPFVTI